MANKNITDINTITSLEDTDLLFVNDAGSFRQIAVNNTGLTRIELLWENASPSSTFPSQIFSLEGDYDALIITCCYDNSYRRTAGTVMIKLNDTDQNSLLSVTWQTNVIRMINITNTDTSLTLDFQSGSKYTTYGGSLTSGDGYCIPLKIYGVKGVR